MEHRRNIRLTHLNDCIKQAEEDLRKCREERNALLLELCSKNPGDELARNGNRYKVYSVSPCAKGDAVWLHCRYWTSAKKWSQGTKVITFDVDG